MRRRLLTIAIFLLAGAVVNVAVAWGFALSIRSLSWWSVGWTTRSWQPNDFMYATTTGDTWGGAAILLWQVDVPAKEMHLGVRGLGVGRLPFPAPKPCELPRWSCTARVYESGHPIRSQDGAHYKHVIENVRGWPCYALRSTYTKPHPEPVITVLEGIELTPCTPAGASWPEPRILPTAPIWPGFAVNTIFYAAILWLLILAFALRRLIRQRRGLCPACGYDLRHAKHEACPECGVTA